MAPRNRIILAVSTILVLVVGIPWFLGMDERRIRKRLQELADTVSMESNSGLATTRAAAAFPGFFTPNVILDTGNEEIDGSHTRDEILSLYMQGRASYNRIVLHFEEPVFIYSRKGKARLTTVATLTLDPKGEASSRDRRNLTLSWEKQDGKWLLSKARSRTEQEP